MYYKRLFSVLLREILTTEETDVMFIEQVILRYAAKKKYVNLEGDDFVLSKKGKKFISF